ncbi:class I SAM-dependent methyltransferase [Chloroflexi bacterium TSY]|nr:class I SAM-dependent methyltransferase [Chloroflexi bacterium TSY]
MFDPIDLSFYADAVIDEVVSGEPQIDGTILLDLARQVNGPILELGCGYGRITIPLAQRGVQDLTGLELSAPSLVHARARTGTLPIRWVEADVRDFHLCQRGCL